MLRDGAWTSYTRTMIWLSFDALKVVRRVTAITEGTRYSVTLYTPRKLERLTVEDWDNLGKTGFPVHLYNPDSLPMRRLEPDDSHQTAAQSSEFIDHSLEQKEDDAQAQTNKATSSNDPSGEADPFQNIPLLSFADADEHQVLDPETLLECCRCACTFNQEHGLPVGTDRVGVEQPRVHESCSMIQQDSRELNEAAKGKNWGEFLLESTDVLCLVAGSQLGNAAVSSLLIEARCQHAEDLHHSTTGAGACFPTSAKRISCGRVCPRNP